MSTHLIFASNPSKGQILQALSNWIGPLDIPFLYFDTSVAVVVVFFVVFFCFVSFLFLFSFKVTKNNK